MKIAIIGGGACGIVSAIYAKRSEKNSEVTVFERSDRILKKLLATGNGKCNLSNASISEKNYFSHNSECIGKILSAFTPDEERQFFAELGIVFCEESGRLYPYSRRANAVCDALRFECEHLGVTIKTNSYINKIEKLKSGFNILGNHFDKVIICSGGFSAPSFGTDGSSFKLLKSLGHRISPVSYALSPVKVKENTANLKGIRALAKVSLFKNGSLLKSESGEVQFTDYGLSGICIMQLSRLCEQGDILKIDLFKEYTYEEFLKMLFERKKFLCYLEAKDFLSGILHKALSSYILSECAIPLSKKVSSITEEELFTISRKVKELSFSVSSVLGKEHSQATSGGAYLCDFDLPTLESKITKGLYCAGEALDCVGDCGGYNLHWAWATGAITGKAVTLC